MEMQKTRIARTILKKKEKAREFRILDFKRQYQTTVIKTVTMGIRIDLQIK